MIALYILPLVSIAYINLDTYLSIDSKHRKHYLTFIVNIIMCLISILAILIKEINYNLFPPIIALTLMGITIWQRKSMIADLRKGKYLKENNKKKR